MAVQLTGIMQQFYDRYVLFNYVSLSVFFSSKNLLILHSFNTSLPVV